MVRYKVLTVKKEQGTDKNYVTRKEIERHLPGYYSQTSLECIDDDEKAQWPKALIYILFHCHGCTPAMSSNSSQVGGALISFLVT